MGLYNNSNFDIENHYQVIEDLLKEYNIPDFEYYFSNCEQGFVVEKNGNKIEIGISNVKYIFRAISCVIENIGTSEFTKSQFCSYENLAFWVDCSRDAVLKVETIFSIIRKIALLGYNRLYVYMEDTFEVENEPYFGHLRGKYTAKEMDMINEYAKQFFIEIIPATQTLAHLGNIFLWPKYEKILDVNDIVLVDNDITYKLIDNMIATLSKHFDSEYIHIGFDEAPQVGTGRYLENHSFTDKLTLLLRHLNKVSEIAKKYGKKIQLWSDMFLHFIFDSKGRIKEGVSIDYVKSLIPDNAELVLWDYYKTKESDYDILIKKQSIFADKINFAGGAWKWLGYVPLNKYGLERIYPSLKSTTKNSVQNYILTSWGDNGGECPIFSIIPQIVCTSEYAYSKEFDIEAIKQKTKAIFNCEYEDLLKLDIPNGYKNKSGKILTNPSKFLLYNDCLMGLFDYHVNDEFKKYFKKCAMVLNKISKNNSFSYIFEMESALSKYLAVKCNMGNELAFLYKNGDKKGLKEYANSIIKKSIKLLDNFIDKARICWKTENKAFGFDEIELRLGGARQRLLEAYTVVNEYCDGKINSIEELEQPKLSYAYEWEKSLVYKHNYCNMASPNLSMK